MRKSIRRKISESIQAKTFLTMLALLVGCCIVIYGMVMIFMPKNYRTELENQAVSDFYRLVGRLEENGWEESTSSLMEFSVRNSASVEICEEDGSSVFAINYAGLDGEASSESMSCSAVFQDGSSGENRRISAVVSLEAVSRTYGVLLQLLPFIAAVILLISIVGALACSGYFSKPLVRICSVARRMAGLDMTWKCEVKRKDEIGILASSLNEMSGRLEEALNGLQAANEKLQQDIEKEREQERQRVDFFTSVSHELKTPVAVVKGELEGMIGRVGMYRDRDVWLRHCLKTVNEMEELVKEILSAARMGGGFQLRRSDLDISRMVRQSCRKAAGRMEDKQIRLDTDIQPEVHYAGDGRLLEKAFSNVIGNAAAYSPAGAVVTVSLRDGVFSVENSGIHIAEEDLRQIFTPFYRVDKSRSRNSGGSGLGLYITRTILNHHGIRHSMVNTENGVKFTAYLC